MFKSSIVRLRPYFLSAALILSLYSVMRLFLFAVFARQIPVSANDLARMFFVGMRMDLASTACILMPFFVWLCLQGQRAPQKRLRRAFAYLMGFSFWYLILFSVIAEYFFFEEFKSRFNTVAVDYVLFPYEVFTNLWQSYPLAKALVLVGVAAFLTTLWLRKSYRQSLEAQLSWSARFMLLAAGLVVCWSLVSSVKMSDTRFTSDRTIAEIANSGPYSLFFAANTRHLDYEAFYATLPLPEAFGRSRTLLGGDGSQFDANPQTLQRKIEGDSSRPKLNVVIMLEESFGSEFWGVLGNKEGLTPNMDALSAEGLLFTHLYATGNRTVRGMEGVLSSFPPLPGDSIVKRHLSDHVETIARVLKRDGYQTAFLYGGRGIFDGMKSYAVRNGYEEFIEQTDFQNPSFTTAWGVADEDLFKNGVAHLRKLHQTGKPFFATFLSVSNHKPYTYPKGRIKENPDEERRDFAVKYSDWALGEFFKLAKQEDFYKDTIFVIVADHGARVYGSQRIPAHSYEIPMIILGPAAVKTPQKVAVLGGSMDVGPTVLGLVGRPYQSSFFGRDLLHIQPESGFALLNHNRDIGIFKGQTLAVMGINKAIEYYRFNQTTRDFDPIQDPGPDGKEICKDGQALFGVADHLYMNQKYFIGEGTEKLSSQVSNQE